MHLLQSENSPFTEGKHTVYAYFVTEKINFVTEKIQFVTEKHKFCYRKILFCKPVKGCIIQY